MLGKILLTLFLFFANLKWIFIVKIAWIIPFYSHSLVLLSMGANKCKEQQQSFGINRRASDLVELLFQQRLLCHQQLKIIQKLVKNALKGSLSYLKKDFVSSQLDRQLFCPFHGDFHVPMIYDDVCSHHVLYPSQHPHACLHPIPEYDAIP